MSLALVFAVNIFVSTVSYVCSPYPVFSLQGLFQSPVGASCQVDLFYANFLKFDIF